MGVILISATSAITTAEGLSPNEREIYMATNATIMPNVLKINGIEYVIVCDKTASLACLSYTFEWLFIACSERPKDSICFAFKSGSNNA